MEVALEDACPSTPAEKPAVRSAEKDRVSTCAFADRVAACVLAAYREHAAAFDAERREAGRQTVVAGICALDSTTTPPALQCVSWGCGTKFVRRELVEQDVDGIRVRDGHAEVLARRGLVDVLYSEIEEQLSLPRGGRISPSEEDGQAQLSLFGRFGLSAGDGLSEGSGLLSGHALPVEYRAVSGQRLQPSHMRLLELDKPAAAAAAPATPSAPADPGAGGSGASDDHGAGGSGGASSGARWRLRAGVSLHLFSSSQPCGNASLKRWAKGKPEQVYASVRADEWPRELALHPRQLWAQAHEGQVARLVKREEQAQGQGQGQGQEQEQVPPSKAAAADGGLAEAGLPPTAAILPEAGALLSVEPLLGAEMVLGVHVLPAATGVPTVEALPATEVVPAADALPANNGVPAAQLVRPAEDRRTAVDVEPELTAGAPPQPQGPGGASASPVEQQRAEQQPHPQQQQHQQQHQQQQRQQQQHTGGGTERRPPSGASKPPLPAPRAAKPSLSATPPGTALAGTHAGRTHTCSDKICRWQCLGLQGGLLAHCMTEPLTLRTITVGRKFHRLCLERALCCRAQDFQPAAESAEHHPRAEAEHHDGASRGLVRTPVAQGAQSKRRRKGAWPRLLPPPGYRVQHAAMLCTSAKLDPNTVISTAKTDAPHASFVDARVLWWSLSSGRVEVLDGNTGLPFPPSEGAGSADAGGTLDAEAEGSAGRERDGGAAGTDPRPAAPASELSSASFFQRFQAVCRRVHGLEHLAGAADPLGAKLACEPYARAREALLTDVKHLGVWQAKAQLPEALPSPVHVTGLGIR
jgi:hypothetical protein